MGREIVLYDNVKNILAEGIVYSLPLNLDQ